MRQLGRTHEGMWNRRGYREMGKEWLDEEYLGEVYCKKCKKEGSLVAEMETAGNNLHIDFYVQHVDQRGTTHFVGRKIFRTLNRRKEAKGESFGGRKCLALSEGQKRQIRK